MPLFAVWGEWYEGITDNSLQMLGEKKGGKQCPFHIPC